MLKHYLCLFVALCSLWLLLSGHFTLEHPLVLVTGILSCLLITWLAWRMDINDQAWSPLKLNYFQLGLFQLGLLKDIILANIDVSLRILRYSLGNQAAISPTLKQLNTSQTENISRVIFANAITLTPGTVSLFVHRQSLQLHALSREAADDYDNGELDRKITALEVKGHCE